MQKKTRAPKKTDFASAMKSFLGYLEGTSKSRHTQTSYKLDLLDFGNFFKGDFRTLRKGDLIRYSDHLKSRGQTANTRRRKLLTLRRFYRYLAKRKMTSVNISLHIPAPYKVEKVPKIFEYESIGNAIITLSEESAIERRNKLLLRILLETGLQVSVVAALRVSAFDLNQKVLAFENDSERKIPLSRELIQLFKSFVSDRETEPRSPLFLGFNRYGPVGVLQSITPRGIELLLKSFSKKMNMTGLTPRAIRHSTVVYWRTHGVSENEVQKRLGLKSKYAFRIYEPILKTKAATALEQVSDSG